jgi:SH3-like domain-containing protein
MCFYTKWRKTRDANGGLAGWTNFEIKTHKSVEERMYLISKYTNK